MAAVFEISEPDLQDSAIGSYRLVDRKAEHSTPTAAGSNMNCGVNFQRHSYMAATHKSGEVKSLARSERYMEARSSIIRSSCFSNNR